MPYQAYRLALVGPKGLKGIPERREQLQRLYFDTTLAGELTFLAYSLSKASLWKSFSHAVSAEKLQRSIVQRQMVHDRWRSKLVKTVSKILPLLAMSCQEACSMKSL